MTSEIEKKKGENREFRSKLQKLKENVSQKKQIIDLDEAKDTGDESNANLKMKNKNIEIAQVTKLKNLVQQYYEEIEFLRAELDKLRARTFPSFLQKPDQYLYPDDK